MAWYLHSFAGVELPRTDTARVRSMQPRGGAGLAPTGVIDFYAGRNVPAGLRQVSLSLGNYSTDWDGLRDSIDSLMALEGQRGRLVMRAYHDAAERTAWARLDVVSEQSDERAVDLGTMTLSWTLLQPHWYGAYHGDAVADLGNSASAWYSPASDWPQTAAPSTAATFGSTVTLAVFNAGNVTAQHVTIRVVVNDVDTASIAIANPEGDCALDIDLSAYDPDDVLLIDSAAGTVTLNGAYAYDIVTIDAGHLIGRLFQLVPGWNNITLAATTTVGLTSPTVSVSYYDAWS